MVRKDIMFDERYEEMDQSQADNAVRWLQSMEVR